MTGNRIELWGKLTSDAVLRITPAGSAILRMSVECGYGQEMLALSVTMTGENARKVAPQLKSGHNVKVCGRLRRIAGRRFAGEAQIEVVAESISIMNGKDEIA